MILRLTIYARCILRSVCTVALARRRLLASAWVGVAILGLPRGLEESFAEEEAPYFCAGIGSGSADVTRVASAPDGTMYVVGLTSRADLPGTTHPPSEPDADYGFVAALSPAGTPLWTSYFHTWRWSRSDWPRAGVEVAITPGGEVWVVGTGLIAAPEDPWPVDRGGRVDRDVWIAKFGADGTPAFQILFGGTGRERLAGVVLTPDGDAIVAGTTESGDFPILGPTASAPAGGRADGFAFRVRADGSEIVWSRTIGGVEYDSFTAMTSDGNGGVVVARRELDAEALYRYDDDDSVLQALELLTISVDGQVLTANPLPLAEYGWVTSLAPSADGSIYVAGRSGSGTPGQQDWSSYVLRLPRGASVADASWSEDHPQIDRICVTPAGQVVVGSDLWFNLAWDPFYRDRSGILLLDADLERAEPLVLPDRRWSVVDVAADSRGGLGVVGYGLAAGFNVADRAIGATRAFVGRIPVVGARAPSRVEVVRSGVRDVLLRWSRDGDPPVRFEVERVRGDDDCSYPYGARHEVAAEVAGDRHRVRVLRLRPGIIEELRLVAVFPSGVRTATPAIRVGTVPAQPRWITAKPLVAGVGVELDWDHGPNGCNTRYELERQIGEGLFEPVLRSAWHPRDVNDDRWWHGFRDSVPPLGLPVSYRVRAATWGGRKHSPWSDTVTVQPPAPTLRVRQTSGTAVVDWCWTGSASVDGGWGLRGVPVRFRMTGTYAASDGSGAPLFDPEVHDLFLYVGDARAPISLGSHAGSRGWKRQGGLWVWQEFGSWVVEIDPRAGKFRLSGCIDERRDFNATSDTVVVGMGFGGLSGGDVRTWTELTAARTGFELR